MPNKPKRYIDPKGNTYHVEQAANKKWVAIRINAGGHRKFFKHVEPHYDKEFVCDSLSVIAGLHDWSVIGCGTHE